MYVCTYICLIHIPCPAQNDYKQRTEARGEGSPLFGYVPSPALSGVVKGIRKLAFIVIVLLALMVPLVSATGHTIRLQGVTQSCRVSELGGWQLMKDELERYESGTQWPWSSSADAEVVKILPASLGGGQACRAFVWCGGVRIPAVFDTGAARNIVSADLVERLQIDSLLLLRPVMGSEE